MQRSFLAVVGAGSCSDSVEDLAAEVGREIARHDAVLICGGLGGVMAAAARGAKEVGGFTIGILPGACSRDANVYIDFPVATNMGQARNAIIVQTADALIAVDGGYGTLSEMALALKIGKPVVAIQSRFAIPGVQAARTPSEAVSIALAACLSLRESSPP